MRVRRPLVRVLLAGALLLASGLSPIAVGAGAATGLASASVSPSSATASSGSPASLSAWQGGIDLYRAGVFTTQKTWYWCTAATVQISRNIVFHRADHTASAQQAYFDWMRLHDRYRLPLSAGVDAAGWTAGFQHFVDSRYRLSATTTFDAALRAAVTNLRRTNLPVALAVDRGNHAWLLTGFTATADPARTTRFTVTSVRVVGPLYGLQSVGGYDMPPDTRLTPTQLRHYFTPWYYAPIRMVWDGKFVSIQPSGTSPTASPSPKASPAPATAKPTARPTPSRTPSPSPTPTATPTPVATPTPAAPSFAASSGLLAAAASVQPSAGLPQGAQATASSSAGDQAPTVAAAVEPVGIVPLLALGVLAVVVVAVVAGRRRARRS